MINGNPCQEEKMLQLADRLDSMEESFDRLNEFEGALEVVSSNVQNIGDLKQSLGYDVVGGSYRGPLEVVLSSSFEQLKDHVTMLSEQGEVLGSLLNQALSHGIISTEKVNFLVETQAELLARVATCEAQIVILTGINNELVAQVAALTGRAGGGV
jgi:hypothetical protein